MIATLRRGLSWSCHGCPGGWADETYLKLALHALVEVSHHGAEIALLRDLYLREGA